MQQFNERRNSLFIKWFSGSATEAEAAELASLFPVMADEEIVEELKLSYNLLKEESHYTVEQKNELAANILKTYPAETGTTGIEHRVYFLKTLWFRYAAAVIIVFGIGAYLWTTTQKKQTDTVQIHPGKNDILPGGQRATLTLADGRTIALDNAANGQLAIENGSEIIKRDNAIIYDAAQVHGKGTGYNTMSTPKGGQYQLTLSDGTRVWLNAASKIIYPTVFNEKTREVKIEGEAYFEVAKNKSKPFIVRTSSDIIEVLGTSFNINAYPNENFTKTSLLKGSIKIANNILQPGQAFIHGKIQPTNIEQDIAWKNGLFNFNNLSFQEAMRQLERWYDVQIIYGNGIPKEELKGKMDRYLTLNDALAGLDGMGARFVLEGRIVRVVATK